MHPKKPETETPLFASPKIVLIHLVAHLRFVHFHCFRGGRESRDGMGSTTIGVLRCSRSRSSADRTPSATPLSPPFHLHRLSLFVFASFGPSPPPPLWYYVRLLESTHSLSLAHPFTVYFCCVVPSTLLPLIDHPSPHLTIHFALSSSSQSIIHPPYSAQLDGTF